jgi:competence ComEA-like helix-hairpin-helix protein
MRNRGATGSDEEMEKIVEYLAKNFGANSAATKVDVNTASISDIIAGLELPDNQARAIVDYRRKNGQSEYIDSLTKVPGVDAAKIDKVRARIEY